MERKRSEEYLLTPAEKAVELLEQARMEGRREILEKLQNWMEVFEPKTGRRFTEWVWGKRRIEQFIEDNSSPKGGE